MFRRKPRIKQIAMAGSGDFIFTFGLGRDGRVYSWNNNTGEWVLQLQQQPAAPPEAK